MTKLWKVQDLEVAPHEDGKNDVVKKVGYSVDLFDGDDNVHRYGTVSLDPPQEIFVPFDELTEETVIGWAKDKLNVEEIETSMEEEMVAKKNPPIVRKSLPWAS